MASMRWARTGAVLGQVTRVMLRLVENPQTGRRSGLWVWKSGPGLGPATGSMGGGWFREARRANPTGLQATRTSRHRRNKSGLARACGGTPHTKSSPFGSRLLLLELDSTLCWCFTPLRIQPPSPPAGQGNWQPGYQLAGRRLEVS